MENRLFIWVSDENGVSLKNLPVKIEQSRGTGYFSTDTLTNEVGGASILDWDRKPFTLHVGKEGYVAQSKQVELSDLVRCTETGCHLDIVLKKKKPTKFGSTLPNLPAFDFQKAKNNNETKRKTGKHDTRKSASKNKTTTILIVGGILVSLAVMGVIIVLSRRK